MDTISLYHKGAAQLSVLIIEQHLLLLFQYNPYTALVLRFLMELNIAIIVTPTSAKTADHIFAIPNTARISTAIFMPSAITIF